MSETKYKSGVFDAEMNFGGSNGFLAQYYSAFQHILLRPVVAEFYVSLNSYELATFDITKPVYIDGVYYAIIEMIVQSTGNSNLCHVKALRMLGNYVSPSK
jgi:hypothetical protein